MLGPASDAMNNASKQHSVNLANEVLEFLTNDLYEAVKKLKPSGARDVLTRLMEDFVLP